MDMGEDTEECWTTGGDDDPADADAGAPCGCPCGSPCGAGTWAPPGPEAAFWSLVAAGFTETQRWALHRAAGG